MNDKGSRYELSALRDKRAVRPPRSFSWRQLRHRREILVHVDCTLKLLDPSIDVGDIKPKRPLRNINPFWQGELGRLILGALRRAEAPRSTAQIVSAILVAGGHGRAHDAPWRRGCGATSPIWRGAGKSPRLATGRTVRWGLV